MRYKILIVADSPLLLTIEVEVLKEKGFLVYTCGAQNTEAMIGEVMPDVVYFQPDADSDIYYQILLNINLSHIPVIYTLAENDIYLVNRERTTRKNHRHVICDNVFDAIKIAITGKEKVYVTSLHNAITN